MAVLVSLSGLPGAGKTTIARELARSTGACLLRIDSIEAALKRSTLRIQNAEDAGYRAAMALAEDNLRLGRMVIADSVNPVAATRNGWAQAARGGEARLLNVEVICSDKSEHRRRVEERRSDIEGMIVPTWAAVLARCYEPWTSERLVVDSAQLDASCCAAQIAEAVKALASE